MASKENRHIRIEDWKGNVYYPESTSAGSTSGPVTGSEDASNDPTKKTYTEGNKTSDPNANGGTAIVISSGSTRQTLFRTSLAGVSFGNVSVNMRLKSSIGSDSANPGVEIIEVNTYFVDNSGETPVETKLNTTKLSGNAIGKSNTYSNVSVVTNFEGTATGDTMLNVEIIVLPDTGATVYFDQLAVAMEMASQAEKAYVDGSTVVLP